MRRRFAICLAGLVLTMGGLCALWFATRPVHRINESTVQQIKEGMTLAEVEAVFGVPAGDYATHPWIPLWSLEQNGSVWVSNAAFVQVEFDDSGRVVKTHNGPIMFVEFVEESWWNKFSRWLGRN